MTMVTLKPKGKGTEVIEKNKGKENAKKCEKKTR